MRVGEKRSSEGEQGSFTFTVPHSCAGSPSLSVTLMVVVSGSTMMRSSG